MAPHSSTLAWKIPWTEEPGGLQSMGSLRAGHDWATSLSLFTFMDWRRKWQPTPVFLLENPRVGGAWQAAVYGVAQNQTQLMGLSSSSSNVVLSQGTERERRTGNSLSMEQSEHTQHLSIKPYVGIVYEFLKQLYNSIIEDNWSQVSITNVIII